MKNKIRNYNKKIVSLLLAVVMVVTGFMVSSAESAAVTVKDPDKLLKDEDWGYGKGYEKEFAYLYSKFARKLYKKNISPRYAFEDSKVDECATTLANNNTTKVDLMTWMSDMPIPSLLLGYGSNKKVERMLNADWFVDHIGILQRNKCISSSYKYKGKYGYK